MKTEIRKYPFEDKEITLIRLTNDAGAYVELSSLGAGIVEVGVPDRDGKIENVVLRYENLRDYMADGPCMGKVPGRYANRIANGRFAIEDKNYELAINNGPNALHGGPTGFQNRIWDVHVIPGGVRFTYVSKDGEEGYPGELTVRAEYVWNDLNILDLYLTAKTNATTVVNLTNHAYWNLHGATSGSVLNHKLKIKANEWLPTDATLIPTGVRESVKATPMDFTESKTIGRDIKEEFAALVYGKGYDNCWVIDGWKEGFFSPSVVVLEDTESGRVLEVGTTQPGVQIYTGNWLEGCAVGPEGHVYSDYDGVAIECQGFPDAPNRVEFPSQELKPGETYDQHIRYSFKVKR